MSYTPLNDGSTAAEEDPRPPESLPKTKLSRLMSIAGLLPAAVVILIGETVNFRVAAIASVGISWLIFGLTYVDHKTATHTRPKWPKVLESANPVIYSCLLPVIITQGEDFARLWVGVVILGSFTGITAISLAIDRPLLADGIEIPDDGPRRVPMQAVAREITIGLMVMFAIMFASNLFVALLGLKNGSIFIILDYVVPYGALGLFMSTARLIGKSAFVRAARREYGDEWWEHFPDKALGTEADPK